MGADQFVFVAKDRFISCGELKVRRQRLVRVMLSELAQPPERV